LAVLAAFVLAPIGGCGDDSAVAPAGTGSLRMLITDSPFPFECVTEAIVSLEWIEVRVASSNGVPEARWIAFDFGKPSGAGAARQGAGPATPGGGSNAGAGTTERPPEMDREGFITILTHRREFNLLHLRGGQTDLLADAEIPAGRYDQMRLVVSEGRIKLVDGREFRLNVPSGAQSGIKLNFEFEIGDGENATLVLDVDLSEAFLAIPGGPAGDDPAAACSSDRIREFRFVPEFAMRLINLAQSGDISGLVLSNIDGSLVMGATLNAVNADDQVVASTTTDENGVYLLMGLPPGVYRVIATATGFHDAEISDVEVAAGQETTNVDFLLLPPE
jgi:hypothetical protein